MITQTHYSYHYNFHTRISGINTVLNKQFFWFRIPNLILTKIDELRFSKMANGNNPPPSVQPFAILRTPPQTHPHTTSLALERLHSTPMHFSENAFSAPQYPVITMPPAKLLPISPPDEETKAYVSSSSIAVSPVVEILALECVSPPSHQNMTFDELIQTHKLGWISQAQISRNGKLLINQHTRAGRQLIESLGGQSLKQNFNIHSLLIDQNGDVFIRHASEQILGKGARKKVFRAKEYKTGKTYAWSVLRGPGKHDFFTSDVIQKFHQFLKDHPDLPFAAVPDFTEYYKANKYSKGVSLDTLYDGDAYNLRLKTETPVLKATMIIRLCEGLRELHSHDFVHLDIKQPNILLKDNNAFWSDYDCVTKVPSLQLSDFGTSGYLPLEYTLFFSLKTPIKSPNLFKADIFAFAVTLFEDLNPNFFSPGYHDIYELGYRKEIEHFTAPWNLKKSSIELQQAALNQWIEKKQKEHETKIPEDNQPYLTYRRLLWKALSPDPQERPDAEVFKDQLVALHAQGELPT